MVEYTRQQLIDAFCRARNCTADKIPEIQAKIQTRLDEQHARIPTDAKVVMKRIALEQLNKEANAQTEKDNATVTL